MNPRFAFALSVVVHPLLMPTYIFILLFLLTPELIGVSLLGPAGQSSLIALLFLSTFAAPALVIYYFHKMRLLGSLHLDTLKDRHLPYLATILIYGAATYLFGWKLQPITQLAPGIAIILGSITLSILIVALISIRWKISAHATGIGGLTGALACLMAHFDEPTLFWPFLTGVVISGFLCSARLQLNAHTPAQLVAGYTLGIATSIGSILYFF